MLRSFARMEQSTSAGRGVERRSSSRRHHRKTHLCGGLDDRRPAKRLFTPEIKRFLKSWLIRRRDNPYPNREEKKTLAVQTGLTYVQVCNWFANWRRKLKNAGGEPQRSTWGHLIKVYNDQAQGNVEHFSICSDDSIWEEAQNSVANVDHCYTAINEEIEELNNGNKFKNHIMEKYLRDLNTQVTKIEPEKKERGGEEEQDDDDDTIETNINDQPKILSKWLQSAVNFRPRRENYVDWDQKKSRFLLKKKKDSRIIQHGREELDAAEALTKLAGANALVS